MIPRRQSNCFQRSHSTIAVAFLQECKRCISGFCLSSPGQFGRRNNGVHIIDSGKVKQRAVIFKNCHVCQTEFGKKLCNFKFLTDLPWFHSKGKFDTSQLLASIDFWQKTIAFHLSTYDQRSAILIFLSCMPISWQFAIFLLQNRSPIYPYFSNLLCKMVQNCTWIVICLA